MSHRCPRCADSPALEPSDLKGVGVQICRSCRSILMTRADLDAILAVVGRNVGVRTPTGGAATYFDRVRHTPRWVSQAHSMRCPHCRYDMYEVDGHGIVIDFCLNCQSIWFDEGELQASLERARKTGAIDLIPDDVDNHDTASLVCYVLDTLTDPKG